MSVVDITVRVRTKKGLSIKSCLEIVREEIEKDKAQAKSIEFVPESEADCFWEDE